MKRTALIVATAAMALTSTLASAQSYGGYYDGRYAQQGQYGNNYSGQTWQRGQRLDSQYRSRDHYVSDYSRYSLRAPPRGYGYYRQDNGSILLAALATGLIAAVIAGNANNGYQGGYSSNPNYGGYGYGGGYSSSPNYGGYGYGGGYGSGPSYGGSSYGGSAYGGGYGQPSYSAGRIYYDSYGRAYTVDRYGRTVWVR